MDIWSNEAWEDILKTKRKYFEFCKLTGDLSDDDEDGQYREEFEGEQEDLEEQQDLNREDEQEQYEASRKDKEETIDQEAGDGGEAVQEKEAIEYEEEGQGLFRDPIDENTINMSVPRGSTNYVDFSRNINASNKEAMVPEDQADS